MQKTGKKNFYITLIIIVLILVLSTVYYSNCFNHDSNNEIFTFKYVPNHMNYGAVLKDGPYGNISSPVKIAYIIGVHPLESKSHAAVLDTIKTNDKALKHCYYIYRVMVTKDQEDYTKGRINGQILAYSFAVPDIKGNNFDLVVDVHSNRGNYSEKLFVFSPLKSTKSERIAWQIKDKLPWLAYYVPPLLPEPTSGPYVSIPLIKSGTPAIIYEVYTYDSYSQILNYAHEFVKTVDKMDLYI
ncbi:MAG: hypothetical protein CIT01_05995 [Methanobacterium sp. BRmetb2]|nr:MAG: hypothetical protein CIT01_05995 [Methanobacterium sp. BRmetb2]